MFILEWNAGIMGWQPIMTSDETGSKKRLSVLRGELIAQGREAEKLRIIQIIE